MEFTCKICGNKYGNHFYNVREMQFGTRDEFTYCECTNCGCLQLTTPPYDLNKYYPKEYFSFQKFKGNYLKEKLNIFRDRYAFGIDSVPGRLLYQKFGEPTFIKWMKIAGVNLQSRILDAGCGNGKLLYRMGNMGFKSLTGIDAFINKDIKYNNGVRIYKRNLFDMDKKCDLIMMHHSLEHMEDQHAVFKKLSELIPTGKNLLIRIPVCSSYAWNNYKENWFALEAPRHYYNHSLKSIKYLVDKYKFAVIKTLYDSRSIQLWGSEQYKNDIPLTDKKSYFVNPENSMFTVEQINLFERETVRLNEAGEGDQIVLFLKKK